MIRTCVLLALVQVACSDSSAPGATDAARFDGARDAATGADAALHGNGAACDTGSDCDTGYCVDGVCCESACDATCFKCALGSGACLPVPAGAGDPLAADPCAAPLACDGAGLCLKTPGQSCTGSADCVSDHCVDGVCCENACDGTCRTCADNPGTCTFTVMGETDGTGTTPCTGNRVCDGAGQCVKLRGETCTAAGGVPERLLRRRTLLWQRLRRNLRAMRPRGGRGNVPPGPAGRGP
jgi:hypothetical protein